MGILFGSVLLVLSIFLILLVLVQRGRGGGLTGALGGMGGSSAFGAKAGDVFTRITIVVAGIWIAASALAGFWANNRGDRLGAIAPESNASPSDLGPSIPPLGSSATSATDAPAGEASGDEASGDTAPATPATPAPADSQ
jgi:preprotein translocase subunit SecG